MADEFAKQADVDKYFKLWKETGEKLETIVGKLDKSEAEKVDLVARVKGLEDKNKNKPPVDYTPPADDDLTKVFTEDNPPQTQEDWDDLHSYSPSYALDLRDKVKNTQQGWVDKRKASQKELQDKHPDMYLRNEDGSFKKFKLDANGNYAKDAAGNIIPDPNGAPHMDVNSEKGKIWMGLATDPKFLQSAKAPTILMKAMESEVRDRKDKEMKDKIDKENKDKEKNREKHVDKTQLAGGGGEPPPDKPKGEVKFNSKEERAHAERQVASGVYKSLEEYCKIRDGQSVEIPAGRGGF